MLACATTSPVKDEAMEAEHSGVETRHTEVAEADPEPKAADAPFPRDFGEPTPRATGPVPEACGKRTSSVEFTAPRAPPPDCSAPPALAVLAHDLPVEQDRTDAIVSHAAPRIAAHAGVPLVASDDLERARALVEEKRWRPDGPVCGQAPPIEAILAETHPHLILARLGSLTVLGSAEVGVRVEELSDPELEESILLQVSFERAGLTGEDPADVEPLPAGLEAPVEDPDDPESWLVAAGDLALVETGGLLGGVLGSGLAWTPFFHLAEPEGTDPWLRIGSTLAGEARERLVGCYPGPGVAAFDLFWTISAEGATEDARVELVASPPGYSDGEDMISILDRARDCIAEVLDTTPWPCPRAEAPVEVSARVCTGMAE